jgi:glycine C-acetyltransferase
MVDDSHAVGVVGPGRTRHAEHLAVIERVDIVTGTLGKAIGGASGGYVAGPARDRRAAAPAAPPVPLLQQPRSAGRGASLRALELIESSHELRDRLRENTAHFRARMNELGFEILPGEHPSCPS